MSVVFTVAVIVGYFAALFVFVDRAIDRNWHGGVVIFGFCAWVVLGLSFVLDVMQSENARNSCAPYGTQMDVKEESGAMTPERECAAHGK